MQPPPPPPGSPGQSNTSGNNNGQEWRRRVLDESERLKTTLREAKKKREETRMLEEVDTQRKENASMDQMKEMDLVEKRMSEQKKRLQQLQGQMSDLVNVDELTAAQFAKLELAQKELEKTNERITQVCQQIKPNQIKSNQIKPNGNARWFVGIVMFRHGCRHCFIFTFFYLCIFLLLLQTLKNATHNTHSSLRVHVTHPPAIAVDCGGATRRG
jgi:Ca2+-dependent lipid-binding protein